jgi:hypothetical protein
MINKEYNNVSEWKKELTKKIGLMGLGDLRKLIPVGDLGYANGWYWNPSHKEGWFYGDMEKTVMDAVRQQGFKFDQGYSSGYHNTDHHYHCTELRLSYSVDSSD